MAEAHNLTVAICSPEFSSVFSFDPGHRCNLGQERICVGWTNRLQEGLRRIAGGREDLGRYAITLVTSNFMDSGYSVRDDVGV